MFLLASDFDRTFYINNYDFKKNVEAVKKFRKNNMFVITTGRSYQDYMNITKNYVPTDYLILNHGATILKNDKVIRSTCISNSSLEKIRKLFDFNNIEYFATKDKESRVSINEDNLSKINITLQDNLVVKKAVDYINNNFNDIKAYILFHKNQFEIISIKTDKLDALKYISEIENIDRINIYTVGDGYTDINMVKYYNGYAVKDAIDDLKDVATNVVNSVSEIIDILDVDIDYVSADDDLTNFINECYNYNHYFEKYMSKIYGNKNNDKNHIVIKKKDEIIGCALINPNKLYIDNSTLDVLTVGSICIKEKYRHLGYFKILMGAIKEEEKKYDFSVLSGDNKLYNKYGYYPNTLNLYKINSKEHKNIEFRTITDRHIDESLNIYNKNIHSNRTIYNFKDILNQWKSESYFIYKDNIFIGYLVYNTKRDYISEIKSTDIKEVIEQFSVFKKRDYINLSILNNDYSLDYIKNDLDSSRMYNRHLYSINNIEKVISLCLNNKLKHKKIENGILSIKVDNNIYKITVNDNEVRVESSNKYDFELDKEQFMNLLLNKKMIKDKLLSSWFSLNLDMYNNDLV